MPDPDKRVEYRGTGFYVGLIAILLFALALLVLAVQNTQEVDVDFFGLVFTVPLFAVGIGAAILAVVLDELIGLMWRRQRRIRLEERAELNRLRAAGARPSEERLPAERDMEPTATEPEQPSDTPTESPTPTMGDRWEEGAEKEGDGSSP
jgi:uncharacterized integral membrane protein